VATFEQVAAGFWEPGATGYHRQPPLTQGMVEEAERVLGVRLPDELLRLLRVQNGGVVAEPWTAFAVEAGDHVPFGSVMGIGPTGDGMSMLDTPYLVQEWGIPAPVVLLDGDGHTWVALDYRAGGPEAEPVVTWFDVDMERELRLAPDFRTFVEGLQPEEDLLLED
jgi:hypothetical protein